MLDGYEDSSLGKEGWEISLNNIKPPQSPKTPAKLLKHETDTQIEFPQFFLSVIIKYFFTQLLQIHHSRETLEELSPWCIFMTIPMS